jgi:hypothetical protein
MPSFSEQLVWRQMIGHFFPSQYYIIVKSFYNVVHYELSNRVEIIGELIVLFEGFVNKEHI